MSDVYDRFIVTVQQHAGISRERAEHASRAVLQTLAERIAKGEAHHLASGLPEELVPWLFTDSDAERFDLEEFLHRVADREGGDLETAGRDARAVFNALGRVLSDEAIRHVSSELPRDYEPLLAELEGRFTTATAFTVQTFLGRVADYAGTRPEDARLATEAVLEALGERIAKGEADDIARYLPVELRFPLLRGAEAHGGKARRMKLEEFLERIAAIEGVTVDQAREHTTGVFRALREALPLDEFLDLTAELPVEYAAVGARP
ncbi:MAG: hypothetical protein JWN65_1313 [Solirubrobacterales bacterium]|jgi:uncharacterized protein (DUF2267 family)|nr:hypothetical protein [Solirubrobacterales bacterium]